MEIKHTVKLPMGQKRPQEKWKKKKYFEANKNKNTTGQNLWDTIKAILRKNFRATDAYIKKKEIVQINNLTSTLRKLVKIEQTTVSKLRERNNNDNKQLLK